MARAAQGRPGVGGSARRTSAPLFVHVSPVSDPFNPPAVHEVGVVPFGPVNEGVKLQKLVQVYAKFIRREEAFFFLRDSPFIGPK